jgi:hypothetical protein
VPALPRRNPRPPRHGGDRTGVTGAHTGAVAEAADRAEQSRRVPAGLGLFPAAL